MIADRAAEQHPSGGRPPPSCQMEQQALRQQGIRGTCRRHRLAYRAHAARKMGVAQGGSGSSDGGHVHRSSLELGLLVVRRREGHGTETLFSVKFAT